MSFSQSLPSKGGPVPPTMRRGSVSFDACVPPPPGLYHTLESPHPCRIIFGSCRPRHCYTGMRDTDAPVSTFVIASSPANFRHALIGGVLELAIIEKPHSTQQAKYVNEFQDIEPDDQAAVSLTLIYRQLPNGPSSHKTCIQSPSGGMQVPCGWDCHTYSRLCQQILAFAWAAGSPFDVLPLTPPWPKEVEPSSVGYLLQPLP